MPEGSEQRERPVVDEGSGKTHVGITRRTLFIGAAGAASLFVFGGINKHIGVAPPVRPPGGQDDTQLFSACIRCQKCFEACPHDIISPAHIEYGILSVRTPKFDFSKDWCDRCAENNNAFPLCVQVCPTKALKLPADSQTETTILGKAVLGENECLAYRLIGCRFCYDACPYEAIELDALNRPSVIVEKYNGCDACEAVCVSLESASISSSEATERVIVVRPRKLCREVHIMKSQALRILVPAAVIVVISAGFFAGGSIGTLSAIGWNDISPLCPLGALTTMPTSKTIVPVAVISVVIGIVAILLLGRAFCAWICPVPVVSKPRNAISRKTLKAGTGATVDAIPRPSFPQGRCLIAQRTPKLHKKTASSLDLCFYGRRYGL